MFSQKGWLKITIFLSLLALLGVAGAGEFLSYPAHRKIGPPPLSLNATPVEIHTLDGNRVSGWIIPGKPTDGVVLLLHGVRADRRVMIDRAKFLNDLGYGVMLIDLPAHGESTGDYITFGAREAEAVKAALAYLAQNQPGERIGVIGVSFGAASLVLAEPNPAPSAVVLESMFPTIEEAVTDRLRRYLGSPSTVLAPLLLQQLPLRFGISPTQLHPIEHIAQLHCPVFIIAGAADLNTTLSETQRIYAAAAQPKQLWIIDGAAHVDLYAFNPKEYEKKIAGFFREYLRKSI